MTILFVSGGFPSKETPLLGIFEWDQAQAVYNAGNKVIFVSLDLRSIRRWRKWGLTSFTQNGVKVYSLSFPIGAVPAWILYHLGSLLLLWAYKKIRKIEGEIDVVHAHFTEMGAISSILKRKYHLPLVITEHSSAINKSTISNYSKYLAKIAYSTADKLIAVSNPLANSIKRHLKAEAKVIPNIVSVSDIRYNPIIHKSFVFSAIGGLIYRKGFDLLIQAFSIFKGEDVKLQIIGDGPLRNDLQKQIDECQLSEQISILGYKSRSEISELLNSSDAFVLASRGETFGVVYIEAMLAGLPVIATCCGGPEDFINTSNGMLVPVDDVKALSGALKRMKEDIESYDKKKIFESCFEQYSPESIARQIVQEYSSLNNEK